MITKISPINFAKEVRELYLKLNVNYTKFQKLDFFKLKSVDLLDVFKKKELYLSYIAHRKKMERYIFCKTSYNNSYIFNENFDFDLSDKQKKYASHILVEDICKLIQIYHAKNQHVAIMSLGIGDGKLASNYSRYLDVNDYFAACDIHEKFLKQAQDINRLNNTHCFDLNLLYYGQHLSEVNESFDIIECCNVAHHLYSFESLAGEINRLLCPNGYFFYVDLVDKTADLYEKMLFESHHIYPAFHGPEWFRSTSEIRVILKQYFSIRDYIRVGPGIAYFKCQKV